MNTNNLIFFVSRVEDHDDLTPIFNRQSDMLNDTYGGFFLAELIESQDENNHCIIVEVGSIACDLVTSDPSYLWPWLPLTLMTCDLL